MCKWQESTRLNKKDKSKLNNYLHTFQPPPNSKIQQEESYHRYLALQQRLEQQRRQQQLERERQAGLVGQLQTAVSNVANNFFNLFG